MEKTQVELIRECLSSNRTVFRYAPDSYALQLLKDYIGNGMGIGALRRSPYAKLLTKPIVTEALALAGNGMLEPWHLEAVLAQYRDHKPLFWQDRGKEVQGLTPEQAGQFSRTAQDRLDRRGIARFLPQTRSQRKAERDCLVIAPRIHQMQGDSPVELGLRARQYLPARRILGIEYTRGMASKARQPVGFHITLANFGHMQHMRRA